MAEHHSGRPRRRQIDEPRLIAFDALRAVNADGAYANLVTADLGPFPVWWTLVRFAVPDRVKGS